VADTPNRELLWTFTPPTGDKAFDAWIAPKRTAAIGRILEAVRKNRSSGLELCTGEIDLATGIYQAFIETRSKLDPFESAKASNRLNKVKRILKGVRKQIGFASRDPYLSKNIKEPVGVAPSPIIQLLFDLQSLENELSWLAKQWRSKANLSPILIDRRPSELEWIAGFALPLVYERNFARRAGRSRTLKQKPSGPTVRFIAATLNELGVLYSDESIFRAMTRLAAFRDGS
jgi:hypothetical protein